MHVNPLLTGFFYLVGGELQLIADEKLISSIHYDLDLKKDIRFKKLTNKLALRNT